MKTLSILGLIGACLVASLAPAPFLLDRAAVGNGEVWRVVTGHLVHATRAHFLFDVGVGALLLLFLRWRPALLLLPPFVGGLVLALCPELDYYTGLSGVLHGWTVLAAVDLARQGDRLERAIASLVLLGVILKTVVESTLGVSLLTSSFDMGGATVFLAHGAGVLGGLGVAAAEAAARLGGPLPPGRRHTVSP